MNRRVAAILVATAIVIAVMFLFPPCLATVTEWGRATLKHEGFHWIGSPACRGGMIDWRSLLWMTGVACALSLLACLELRDGGLDHDGPTPRGPFEPARVSVITSGGAPLSHRSKPTRCRSRLVRPT